MWVACSLMIVLGTTRHPVLLHGGLVLIVMGALCVGQIMRMRQVGSLTVIAMCIIGIGCGATLGYLRILALTATPLTQLAQQQRVIEFVGTVQADPIITTKREDQSWSTRTQTSVAIRLEEFSADGQKFRIRVPVLLFAGNPRDEAVRHSIPGMSVRGTARLTVPALGRPYAAYLSAVSRVHVSSVAPHYQVLASDFRSGLVRALQHTPTLGAQLAPGLALGDTRAITESVSTSMRTAGLSHLTAVSGANVTILLLVVLGLTRQFGSKSQVLIAGLVLLAFVVIVRPQPSVLRAAVMGVVVLLGSVLKRKSDALAAVAGAIFVLLIFNPLLAVSYGFALSVVATMGLVVWSPKLIQILDAKLPQAVPGWLLQGLVVTLAAQVAVAPLLLSLGAQISLAAIPANLLCVPLASVSMLAGVVTALSATVCFPVAQLTAWFTAIPALCIAEIANKASQATWLVIPWPHGPSGVLLSASSILVGCWLCVTWKRLSASAHCATASAVLLAVSSLWIHPDLSWRMWPPQNWMMVSCDVGQGDATVIKVAQHQAVVIDVGPEPTLIDQCLTRLHINQIPLLILTHFHADHIGGLAGALHHRTVAMVRTSPLNEPNMTYTFADSILTHSRIKFTPMSAGEKLMVQGVAIECLWPARILREQGSDPNNASLVLKVRTMGTTLLLAGDVEAPAQQEIVRSGVLTSVDVLKIAHHGSRNQDSDFARSLKPRIGIISDGQRNPYGHPSPETIALYEALGTRIFRTDEHGEIAILGTVGKHQVSQASQKPNHYEELALNPAYLQVVTQR